MWYICVCKPEVKPFDLRSFLLFLITSGLSARNLMCGRSTWKWRIWMSIYWNNWRWASRNLTISTFGNSKWKKNLLYHQSNKKQVASMVWNIAPQKRKGVGGHVGVVGGGISLGLEALSSHATGTSLSVSLSLSLPSKLDHAIHRGSMCFESCEDPGQLPSEPLSLSLSVIFTPYNWCGVIVTIRSLEGSRE